MNSQESNDSEEESEIVELAGSYLDTHPIPTDPELKNVLRDKIETWEERLSELDDDDPLYEVTRRELDERRDRLDQLEDGQDGMKQELLSKVADDFVAEGVWLEPSVLETLNYILFGKFGDQLVVKREIINPESEFEQETLYEVSTAVRELAQEELE